jgi:glycosyltransferase involved in cell wall biosynthesis
MSIALCITCYDLDFYLLDGLLEQFKNQTDTPDEIIISSSGIKNHLLKKYKNVQINNKNVPIKNTNQEQRCVQSVARNAGASMSESDYIMFFDVDDIPHPQKIEFCKHHIQGYDFLLHNYQINNSKFENIKSLNIDTYHNFSINSTHTNLIVDNNFAICHGHLTVKSEIFKSLKYQQISFGKKEMGEDGKFCQDLVRNGYRGIFLNVPLISYSQ